MKKLLNGVGLSTRIANWLDRVISRVERITYRTNVCIAALDALDNKETTVARITSINGNYALTLNGKVVATYTRARDAKRGAQRRGLTVA